MTILKITLSDEQGVIHNQIEFYVGPAADAPTWFCDICGDEVDAADLDAHRCKQKLTPRSGRIFAPHAFHLDQANDRRAIANEVFDALETINKQVANPEKTRTSSC